MNVTEGWCGMNVTERMCDEVDQIRGGYIDSQVQRNIARRDGEATAEQIEEWETDAAVRWDTKFPALAKLAAS